GAPAEGSNVKPNAPAKKQKQGRKGKKPVPPNQRGSGQVEDSEEAFAAAPDRKGPRGPPRGGGGLFDNMLKKPCPYHKGSVNHTLEQCEMLKKYYNHVAHRDEDKKKDAGEKGGDVEFPPVENAYFIFGGPTTNMTSRQRKRERWEVFSVTKATPSYLNWSKDTITFGHEDHPDYVPHPGRYPLVVDPIIGNTRFSKVLMDGGSSLNIMYARTLELMGIGLNKLRPQQVAISWRCAGEASPTPRPDRSACLLRHGSQ